MAKSANRHNKLHNAKSKKALHYFLSLAPTQRCIYFSSAEMPPILTSILLTFRRLLPVACTCLLRHINNIFLLALHTSFYPVLTPFSMPPSRRSERPALQSLAIRTLAQWSTNSAIGRSLLLPARTMIRSSQEQNRCIASPASFDTVRVSQSPKSLNLEMNCSAMHLRVLRLLLRACGQRLIFKSLCRQMNSTATSLRVPRLLSRV
jgi:hypothetical protein